MDPEVAGAKKATAEEASGSLGANSRFFSVCGAAWDRLRLQLGVILRRAAQDLNFPPGATVAAGAAFYRGFQRFVTDHLAPKRNSSSESFFTPGVIKEQDVRRFIAACLFAAGKAADENITLRQVVASVGFCFHACTTTPSDELTVQTLSVGGAHVEVKSDRLAGQAEDGSCRAEGNVESQPPHLGGYRIMTFRQYWRERQGCFVEEQRLMQSLGFVLPGNEGGTLSQGRRGSAFYETLIAAVVLARLSPVEATLALALAGDAAAFELAKGESPVVFAAAVTILAAKLSRRFKALKPDGGHEEGENFLKQDFPDDDESAESEAETLVAEPRQTAECTDSSSAFREKRQKSSVTSVLLRRLEPLLQGLKNASFRGVEAAPPVCIQVASCCQRILLSYALLLQDPPCSVFTELVASHWAEAERGVS